MRAGLSLAVVVGVCSVFARHVAPAAFAAPAASNDPSLAAPAPVFPRFAHELFDTPILANGYFGDHRSNHFHAGLDLGTGGLVGRAIHAPDDAVLERVRTSGVGYGRSLYYETADGRLLVFGHLDAFAQPVAGYVAAIQDSSERYDQDLWPAAGRFRVKAGDIIGWTGRSGTGGPHLHVEIRRGDMAINPLLAGYAVEDWSTPRIERVTLVPLDDSSWVSGSGTPSAFAFAARDTVSVTGWGRLRVVVEALDAESDGTYDVAPWRTLVSNGEWWVRCAFDSVSWATDMSQSDFVYDRGRYTGRGKVSLVLGSPEGTRPAVIFASTPAGAEAGVVVLDAGHVAEALVIEAADLAGHSVRKVVRLRAVRPPDASHAPVPATNGPVLRMGADESGHLAVAKLATVEFPKAAVFERTSLRLRSGGTPKSAGELTPVGRAAQVLPANTPLARGADVALNLPGAIAPAKIGLYRDAGDGWDYVGDHHDVAKHTISGSTRHLGTFALFKDTRAPRGTFAAPSRAQLAGAYPRWAIEAPLADKGSGVDASATYFIVDGRRVPSEWDSVIETLRWKPLRAPSSGRHTVVLVATDRAGNTRKTSGAFVLN